MNWRFLASSCTSSMISQRVSENSPNCSPSGECRHARRSSKKGLPTKMLSCNRCRVTTQWKTLMGKRHNHHPHHAGMVGNPLRGELVKLVELFLGVVRWKSVGGINTSKQNTGNRSTED